jgi:hypothetical protein
MIYTITLIFKNGHTVTERMQEPDISLESLESFVRKTFPPLQNIMMQKDETAVLTIGYTIFRVSELAAMSFRLAPEDSAS